MTKVNKYLHLEQLNNTKHFHNHVTSTAEAISKMYKVNCINRFYGWRMIHYDRNGSLQK